MLGIEINCGPGASSEGWTYSPIISVGIGALIAFLGTALSSFIAWKVQKRGNAHSLVLQQRQFDFENTIRRQAAHRSRGEEIYSANAKLREELRVVVTENAKKLEDQTFVIWDIEGYFTAGRDSLSRMTLLIELDYPALKAPMNQLASAFKDLAHTKMPENGVPPMTAASALMENMSAYGTASHSLSQALMSEMKSEVAAGLSTASDQTQTG